MDQNDIMRQRGEWMKPTDDQILEILEDSGMVLTPSVVAFNLGFSRTHVANRFSAFEERQFINKIERGKYEIADRGSAYLRGQYDASKLDE